MKANLRAAYSTDVDVETYVPADPDDDGVWVRLLVGPADGPGEESLDVLVCTVRWLDRVLDEHGPQLGRGHLLMHTLDLRRAVAVLREHVEGLEGADWNEVGQKLSRIGRWEFEDYRP